MLHKIKNWLIVLVFGVSVYAYSGTQGGTLPNEKSVNIEELLQNKTAKEKAQIKSEKISKIKLGKFTKNDLRIEVIGEITAIEINGQYGIEFFAKAWKNGKQLGFGKDGTVDIERFRIYNPPVLVDDINGEILREWIEKDIITDIEEYKFRKLRYDPTEAIRQSLAHIIETVGKDGKNIIEGKIGNTTSTFYPAAGANSPVDGRTYRGAVTEDFATIVAGSGSVADEVSTVSGTPSFISTQTTTDKWKYVGRMHTLFDTASIPDTDAIDSATYSIWVINFQGNTTVSYNVTATNPASNDNLVASDHQTVSNTKFATDILTSDMTSGQYTDWTFNNDGKSNISKTGISKFALRVSEEIDGSSPTWVSGIGYGINSAYYADQTGTANDPKLVVVHSSAVTFVPKMMIF